MNLPDNPLYRGVGSIVSFASRHFAGARDVYGYFCDGAESMIQVDLIRLWALNEVVQCQRSLQHMVWHPKMDGPNYWRFPSDNALEASPAERLSRIRDCISAEEMGLYEEVDGIPNRYTQVACEEINEQALSATSELSPYIVAITTQGHNRWESEFCPDWGRFWLWREKRHNRGDSVSFEVTCATSEMLNAVLEVFPSYLGLDTASGLKGIRRWTVFGVHATFWKVFPIAERAEFKASLGLQAENARIRESIDRCAANPSESPQILDWLEHRSTERANAERTLQRLSTVW